MYFCDTGVMSLMHWVKITVEARERVAAEPQRFSEHDFSRLQLEVEAVFPSVNGDK